MGGVYQTLAVSNQVQLVSNKWWNSSHGRVQEPFWYVLGLIISRRYFKLSSTRTHMTLFETTWRIQIGISQYSGPNLWPLGDSLLVMMNIPTHGLTSHWSLRCFVVLLLQEAIASFLCVVISEHFLAVLNFSLISCCGSTVCLTVSWAYLWSHSRLRNTTARQQGYVFNAKLIWDLGILQKGSCPKGPVDPVLEIVWNCNDLPPTIDDCKLQPKNLS